MELLAHYGTGDDDDDHRLNGSGGIQRHDEEKESAFARVGQYAELDLSPPVRPLLSFRLVVFQI